MIDLTQLSAETQSIIAGLDADSSMDDILAVVLALSNITPDRSISVPDVDSLPDLSELGDLVPNGSIYYVESLQNLVFAADLEWRTLEGDLVIGWE